MRAKEFIPFLSEATGDEKFDSMMGRIANEPKVPDRHPDMPPTSIPELLQWAKANNKPYHYKFAEWARRHNFTNVNAALMWFGDNVDPWDEFGPKDHLNVFGDLVGEPLIDAAKHDPKAAELLKVYACYEKIVFDWTDEYRQMKEQGVAEAGEPENPSRRGFLKKLGAAGVAAAMPGTAMKALAEPAAVAWPAAAAVNIGLNGLTVLSSYGFFFDIPRLDSRSKEKYLSAWPELFQEIPQVLNRPGGFWDNVYKLPVAHADTTLPSEKAIEDLLLNDKEFLDLVENSKAAKLLASSVDKDSREDVIRTGVTNRVIRFIINNFYNKKLTRNGFVDKQDDDDSTSSTGREKSQAASPTTSTGSSSAAKSTLPFDLARLAGIAKRGYDAAMSTDKPEEPPVAEPQKPQALPAPQKPDIDLTPDLKQKQQEPVKRNKDENK